MTGASRSSISDRFLRSEQGVRKRRSQESLGSGGPAQADGSYGKCIIHTVCKGKNGTELRLEVNQAHCTRGHRMS